MRNLRQPGWTTLTIGYPSQIVITQSYSVLAAADIALTSNYTVLGGKDANVITSGPIAMVSFNRILPLISLLWA